MATYINNYGGMGSTNTSCYGVTGCKWKPRKVSAKRDFPKAFDEVAMHHTKLSEVEPPALLDVLQNISGDGHDDVSQFPKKRKVSAVNETSMVIAGNHIENVAPVESKAGFTKIGKFDLSNESTDTVRVDYSKDELVTSDSVSVESSSGTDMRGSDYVMRPHTTTTTEHEDPDVIELINADKETRYAKRKVSAIRCFPPGCGRNTFAPSEEDLERDLAEFEEYSSTCEACRDDDIEEECYSEEAESDDELELHEEACRDDDIEEDSYSEAESDDYTELELREENAEEKRQCQTDDQMMDKERDSCEQLRPCRPRVWAVRCFPPGCGPDAANLTEEDVRQYQTDDQMMDKERDPHEQLRPCKPRVWAVRCFPPGCGPDAANLTEEDVKVALTESRKGMLTCKSCCTK